MRNRSLKPALYLYVEAKKEKETTEYLYFSLLSRHLDYVLKPYSNLNKLKRESKNKQKNDIIAAVIDMDVDQNNLANSLNSREKAILDIQSKIPNILIIISNRFMENWIVYYFEDCNRFEEDSYRLPIPSYHKNRTWYLDNEQTLISEIEVAKKRAKQRRIQLTQICPCHCLDGTPALQIGSIKTLYESQAFSYMDILIDALQKLSD